jgi:hypothetical protein
MPRWFLHVLVVAAILFGTPCAAPILNRAMGSWSATAIEADGSQTRMEFGSHLPRPDWVPIPSDASIVQASRSISKRWPDGFHVLDLMSRASTDELVSFYRTRLTELGFEVRDLGSGPLNAAAANYLGVANMMEADRAATDDHIVIQIGTPEGIVLASRSVQLRWYKLNNPGFVVGRHEGRSAQ